jgi:TolA-binding protein
MRSKKRVFYWAATLLLMLCLSCNAVRDGKAEDAAFEAARREVHNGAFDAAIDKLTQFERLNPESRFGSRVSFLKAKSHLGLSNFVEAKKEFQSTIERFGDSEEARKSEFKLAMIDIYCEEIASAKIRLQDIVDSGNNAYLPEAKAWLAHWKQAGQ